MLPPAMAVRLAPIPLKSNSTRIWWRGLQPAGVSPCKVQNPQAEARATYERVQ